MNFYLLFITALTLIGIKIYPVKFNKQYLSKENTACIKGIFILIVFISHANTYINYDLKFSTITQTFLYHLSQLMVTMFLFYSGYGVLESIKKKKQNYVDNIPRNRILKTLFHFDVVILTFLIINIILGNKYGIIRILLSFTGWLEIGNSNWYIFSILVLYFTTYLSFSIFKNDTKKAVFTNVILTILIMISLYSLKGSEQSYWYNTLLCYPFGLIYSLYKDSINKLLFNNKTYYLLLITLLIIFICIKKVQYLNIVFYSIVALMFVFLIVMVTMKVNINNRYLKWFGDNLFYMYILQRIPMIVLTKLGYVNNHGYRFLLLSFIITVVLSIIYKAFLNKADEYLFKKK